ncbi:MAG: hypothetical protein HBSAPP03_26900 [Phycisphaerae bacterium]|nr:MAG: hypothetical protein HBSAPP03_26900 [Phycisphaerae bacterium]
MTTPRTHLALAIIAAAGSASAVLAQPMNWDGSCGTNLWSSCCWNGQSGGACQNNNNFASGSAACPDCPPYPGVTNDVDMGWASVTLDVPGTVRSMFAWSPFTLANDLYAADQAMFGGQLTVMPGGAMRHGVFISEATATIVSGLAIREGAEYRVQGVTTWQGGGITLDESMLKVLPGATFRCQANAAIAPESVLGQIVNTGTFRKDSGTGTTTVNALVTSNALISAEVGVLDLVAGGTLSGYIQSLAAGTLRLSGSSPFVVNTSLTTTGAGQFHVNAPFTVPAGATASSNHVTFGANTLRDGAGMHTIVGNASFRGTFDGGGSTETELGSFLTVPASASVSLPNHLLVLNGPSSWGANVALAMGASSMIRNHGSLTVNGDITATAISPTPGVVRNHVDWIKLSGAGDSLFDVQFFNHASFTLFAGTLYCRAFTQVSGFSMLSGGSLGILNGGTADILAGTIGGTAAVRGSLRLVVATLAPGNAVGAFAVLRAPGGGPANLTFDSPQSRLEIDINGVNPGSFDTVVVEDHAVLAGTVRVTFTGGFVPQVGQSFRILSAGSIAGAFLTLDKVNAPPDLPMTLVYDAAGVTLVIGPTCDPDVNCDGAVNGIDVEIQELAVGGDMADYCLPDADFNQDGAVNGTDVEAVELAVGGGGCP